MINVTFYISLNSFFFLDDWNTALANLNQLVDPISEQSLSGAIRLYISAPKDAQAEVDYFTKV